MIELFIGIYIFMKAQRNGKNIKICLAKTKKKKNMSNNKNNNKRIRMFWRETTAL